MQDVGFLISQNLVRSGHHRDLSPSCLRLCIFGDSRDKSLLFRILVNFVLHLAHDVVDFGAELVQQVIRL